jgi:RNA polymerase sigma-70 factor (sigma-E family)
MTHSLFPWLVAAACIGGRAPPSGGPLFLPGLGDPDNRTGQVNLSGPDASRRVMISSVERPVSPEPGDAGTDPDLVLAGVFRDHYIALVGLARLLVDDRGEAEELVQEAFARTYAAWGRLRHRDDPLAYVRRTVVNLARGGLRRRGVARRARLLPSPDASSAEVVAFASARRSEIIAAVRALPSRQRECVALRYALDLPIAQIARELGIAEGSVKQHLHRARAALTGALGDEEET